MGFLGLFGGSGGALKKHAARVANRRAQAADRWDSIQQLGAMGTAEAVDALLDRFTFVVDPSITDQEEKDATFQAIVRAGDTAVAPTKDALQRTDSIAWPLKCLEQLLTDEEVTTELLEVLRGMDTEYERDPQKKMQILSALEERRDGRIVEAVTRFLDDMNETARFHAVAVVFAEEEVEQAREALRATIEREDSVRVRVRILDEFMLRGWDLGEHADKLREKLPQGYAIDAAGKIRKK